MIELNNLAHKHLQRGTQEFQDLLATYYKQTKKVITAQDTFSGQNFIIYRFYTAKWKSSAVEKVKRISRRTSPTKRCNKWTLQRRNQLQIKLQTSASSSLKSDKSGPSGYQKKQRGKYVEQNKGKQVPLLKNKIGTTSKFRKDHRL